MDVNSDDVMSTPTTGVMVTDGILDDLQQDGAPVPLLEGAVVVTTMLVLGWTKVITYVCLTRGAPCARFKHSRGCWLNGGSAGTGTCHCRTFNTLPWHMSTLAIDFYIYPFIALLGFYAIHCTDVRSMPLHGGDAPAVTRYMICVVLATLLVRLILILTGPGQTCKFRISFVYVVFGIVIYLSILITGENTLLACVGMISQLNILFQTLRQVVLKLETSSCAVWAVNVLRLTVIAVFSLLLPIIYVSIALSTQAVNGLGYYSVAVFAFATAFFGIASVVTFVQALVNACSDLAVDTDAEETRCLLAAGNYKTRLTAPGSFVEVSETTKVPIMAYTFTFPKLDTK